MFQDFINNYRRQRAPERQARDQQYEQQRQQILRQNTGKIGTGPATALGLAGVSMKQGLDNVSRGTSDFFSAYKDAINPGHGKIEPMAKSQQLKSFQDNVDRTVVDISNPEAIDFVKKFRVKDDSGKKRDVYVGYVYGSEDERKGGYGGRIAAILDEKYYEQPFSGKQALTDYFKNNFSMDEGEYEIDDYGTISNPSGSSRRDLANGNTANGITFHYSVGKPRVGGKSEGKDWYFTSQFSPWEMFPGGHQ